MKLRRPTRPRRVSPTPRPQLRRGIFLIPTLFTVGNMLAGFAAMLHAINGRLTTAAWLLLLAGLLDGLDGRIARLTGAASEFGKEYDSLADVVSFGVAPAILVYMWGISDLGRTGWAVAFLYLAAGSVRLARFNVHAGHEHTNYFTGLPIPAGAGALALMVLMWPSIYPNQANLTLVSAVVIAIGLLMVSTVPYRSYKNFRLQESWPATAFFVLAVIIAIIVVSPVPPLAALCATYLVSGPVELALRGLRGGPRPRVAAVPPRPGSEGEPHD